MIDDCLQTIVRALRALIAFTHDMAERGFRLDCEAGVCMPSLVGSDKSDILDGCETSIVLIQHNYYFAKLLDPQSLHLPRCSQHARATHEYGRIAHDP